MLESFRLARSAALVDACWQEKTAATRRLLGQEALRLMRPEVIGDRTRFDVQWNGSDLGLFATGRSFVRLDEPDTPSPAILEMIADLRATPMPLKRASLRLRSGHDGSRGLWIDAANEDVKKLLDDGTWLATFLEKNWTLEIGQKHKAVARKGAGGWGLEPATPKPWLASFDKNNDELPLLSLVSLFSQPGPEVNRSLIAAGFELCDESGALPSTWAEWGAGYGNLSAAFASQWGTSGWASEWDPRAAELLESNAKQFFPGVRTSRAAADDHDATSEREGMAASMWLLDPPRSGFGELLRGIPHLKTPPEWVLSYHCHAQGLERDTELLRAANYRLRAWSSVDAFPATPHHEVITLWRSST